MYKIHFLNDNEFEALPGVNMQTKLGVAYPEDGVAYVRTTGSSPVDVFTAIHELEHLKGSDLDEHYDSENKCFYKDFGQTLKSFVTSPSFWMGGTPIQGLGPLADSMVQGGGGQQEQQTMQDSPIYPTDMAPESPNVVQASGAGTSGLGKSGSATGGVKSLRGLPQFNDIASQQYGNISGRSPLMDVFGGQ